MIKIGRRGSITGKLKIIGEMTHVAYPNRGNNPSTTLVKILNEIKNYKFDKGNKHFQPTNLEVIKIIINNSADNIIPGIAEAVFNIRFNNMHSSVSLKENLIIFSIRYLKKINQNTKLNIEFLVKHFYLNQIKPLL